MTPIKFAHLGHNEYRGFIGSNQVARIIPFRGLFSAEIKTSSIVCHRHCFLSPETAKIWVEIKLANGEIK